jgi:hypothetical protein
MINGRMHSGKCQPEQASRERAQAAARAMATWWRSGCPSTGATATVPAVERLGLFPEET